jgi:acetyl esterase/lipase
MRSVVGLVEGLAGHPYRWTEQSDETADELDFVVRAAELTAQPPLLLVSGERDHPDLRTDAAALVDALRARYAHPDEVELVTVPDLAHPLAEEPGMEPAPQLPTAKAVDEILTRWFVRQLRN